MRKVTKPDHEWKAILTREEYRILRQSHTERPFSGKYNDFHEDGVYACAACGNPLFSSAAKYDHGTGWPSFWAPLDEERLEVREDASHGMRRTEVRCADCGSHLGHVFDDGPAPTGKHYCINSAALRFTPSPSAGDARETGSPTGPLPEASSPPATGTEGEPGRGAQRGRDLRRRLLLERRRQVSRRQGRPENPSRLHRGHGPLPFL